MPKISAGCNTCRKRKKGCDMQRPSCGQCKKLGVLCTGYGRPLKFIHTSNRVYKHGEAHASPDKIVSISKGAIRPNSSVTGSIAGLALTGNAEALQKSVLAESCPGLFLNLYLGSTGSGTGSVSQSCFTGWMVTTSQISSMSPTLRNALLALGLARVGKLSHDSRIMHKSQQFYSSALLQLYQCIKKNTNYLDDESLAGVMYLSLYEAIEGSPMRGLGWASHTDGATRLIKLQPYSSEWTDFRKKLFLGLRYFAVIRAIGSRQPSFLASPEWTSLPWLPVRNQHSHQILCLLASIPSLLQDIDAMRDDQPSSLSFGLTEVSKKCSDLLNKFHLWNDFFRSERRGLPYLEMPSTISTYEGKEFAIEHPIFSTYLHFLDTETAHLQMLYWTAQLLICNNLWLLYQSVASQEHQTSHGVGELLFNSPMDGTCGFENKPQQRCIPELPISTPELYAIAINIARSLEYFLTPELMAIGATMFAFPVTVSLGYFQYFKLSEAAWFQIIFDHILLSSGIDVGGFLEAVANENSLSLVRT